jgi:hypothetical protein
VNVSIYLNKRIAVRYIALHIYYDDAIVSYGTVSLNKDIFKLYQEV